MAAQEGVFVEPASAASVAGLLKAAEQGKVDPGQRIVCTVTGNGLKDPDWAVAGAPQPVTVPVDADAAAERLGLARPGAVRGSPYGDRRTAAGRAGDVRPASKWQRLQSPGRQRRGTGGRATRIVRLLCALCRHRTFLR